MLDLRIPHGLHMVQGIGVSNGEAQHDDVRSVNREEGRINEMAFFLQQSALVCTSMHLI